MGKSGLSDGGHKQPLLIFQAKFNFDSGENEVIMMFGPGGQQLSSL